eukprot:COSAG06_NODE_1650_length_8805_cov_12.762807_8_plen_73_part_00
MMAQVGNPGLQIAGLAAAVCLPEKLFPQLVAPDHDCASRGHLEQTRPKPREEPRPASLTHDLSTLCRTRMST